MRAGSLASALEELVLPSLCLRCGSPLPGGAARGLCGSCWSDVSPRPGPACPACGAPSDRADVPCLGCDHAPPPQQATVAWGEYDGVLRDAVLALKHHGHDELARPLGRRLATAVAWCRWSSSVEVVTAVPSHPLRRVRRGFAAAELLAREVAAALGVPFRRLLRRRGLATQAGRSRAQRLRLPSRAFAPRFRHLPAAVLVVDDVTTTGTTLRAAARVLCRSGASPVWCAALAAAPDPWRSV